MAAEEEKAECGADVERSLITSPRSAIGILACLTTTIVYSGPLRSSLSSYSGRCALFYVGDCCVSLECWGTSLAAEGLAWPLTLVPAVAILLAIDVADI